MVDMPIVVVVFCEIESSDNICPKCGQSQDWYWFGKYNKNID